MSEYPGSVIQKEEGSEWFYGQKNDMKFEYKSLHLPCRDNFKKIFPSNI